MAAVFAMENLNVLILDFLEQVEQETLKYNVKKLTLVTRYFNAIIVYELCEFIVVNLLSYRVLYSQSCLMRELVKFRQPLMTEV